MIRKQIFLLCCMFFAMAQAYCQLPPRAISGKTIFKHIENNITKVPAKKISPSMLISRSFYSGNLAFFCRQELKFEKATKIPFKFRLGSVQQVDFLEGKTRAY